MNYTHLLSAVLGGITVFGFYHYSVKKKIQRKDDTIRSLRKSWERMHRRNSSLKEKRNY